nr:hypothetical protein [Nostoc sp. EkiNYC01]
MAARTNNEVSKCGHPQPPTPGTERKERSHTRYLTHRKTLSKLYIIAKKSSSIVAKKSYNRRVEGKRRDTGGNEPQRGMWGDDRERVNQPPATDPRSCRAKAREPVS